MLLRRLPTLAPMSTVQGRVTVLYARVVAGAYLVLGLVGLMRTGFDFFSNVDGYRLLWFTVNPLTCVIHVCVGMVGIPMSNEPVLARRFLVSIGALGLPFAVVGYLVDGTLSDFFARNPALVTVHLTTAVLALTIALWPTPRQTRDAARA